MSACGAVLWARSSLRSVKQRREEKRGVESVRETEFYVLFWLFRQMSIFHSSLFPCGWFSSSTEHHLVVPNIPPLFPLSMGTSSLTHPVHFWCALCLALCSCCSPPLHSLPLMAPRPRSAPLSKHIPWGRGYSLPTAVSANSQSLWDNRLTGIQKIIFCAVWHTVCKTLWNSKVHRNQWDFFC